MRKLFGKQNAATAADKDLKSQVLVVNGRSVCVERKIAEGGFSNVYLVRGSNSSSPMALKRQFVNEPRLLEACRREAEIVKNLGQHPNIVTHIASSLQPVGDGIYEYLLLTKYYRESVFQLMNERLAERRYLGYKDVLSIFCSACCAVAQLHHCQPAIIHRDLKVENLLLAEDGTCVLCDFGSATTRVLSFPAQPISMLEEEVARFTTLSYRSPEMIDLYQGRPITVKSDIWALGVMLYKLCYFTLPFKDSAFAIQNSSFSFPSEPAYPENLKSLISYMLNPDSDDRPDIFQVSYVAFALRGRPCPVPNVNKVPVPDVNSLADSRCKSKGQAHSDIEAPACLNVQIDVPSVASTTVTPRQRPKPTQASSPSLHLFPEPYKAATAMLAAPKRRSSASSTSETSKNGGNEDDAGSSTQGIGHKRNTSDSYMVIGENSLSHVSAFRPYRSEKRISVLGVSDSYNPFDINDDCFGYRFDELPRCRAMTNSSNNLKGWENMASERNAFDDAPFALQYGGMRDLNAFADHNFGLMRRYQKLVNAEDSEFVKGRRSSDGGEDQVDGDDSVGSASDLQARMAAGSTSSEYEDDISAVNDESVGFERSVQDEEPADLEQESCEPEVYGRRPLLADESEMDDSEPADDTNLTDSGPLVGDVFSKAPFTCRLKKSSQSSQQSRDCVPCISEDWRSLIRRTDSSTRTPTAFVNSSFQEDETYRL